jgi:hypothetical protein
LVSFNSKENERERERDPELATRDSIQWLWMELFSPIRSIIETVDLISTIPDNTLGSLSLSLAHNKQLYGYIYIYISACISTEVS